MGRYLRRCLPGAGIRLILGIFALVPIAWGQAPLPPDDAASWLIEGPAGTSGQTDVTLSVSPLPLLYGSVVDATIEVSNGTPRDLSIRIKALLTEGSQFVDGNFGVAFENPHQAEHQRKIIWPTLYLPSGSVGQVTFQFLVTWDTADDTYIEVEAIDESANLAPAVSHLSATPQLPPGGTDFLPLAIYAVIFLLVVASLVVSFRRSVKLFQQGKSIKPILGATAPTMGVVLLVLPASLLWNELDTRLLWQPATCDILDVRYTVDTTTSSNSSGPSTTHYHYSGSLTLKLDGPQGPVITSGYRRQSGISDPKSLNAYQAGTSVSCFYDEDNPLEVVVDRDLNFWSLTFYAILTSLGVGLLAFGLRHRWRAAQHP